MKVKATKESNRRVELGLQVTKYKQLLGQVEGTTIEDVIRLQEECNYLKRYNLLLEMQVDQVGQLLKEDSDNSRWNNSVESEKLSDILHRK